MVLVKIYFLWRINTAARSLLLNSWCSFCLGSTRFINWTVILLNFELSIALLVRPFGSTTLKHIYIYIYLQFIIDFNRKQLELNEIVKLKLLINFIVNQMRVSNYFHDLSSTHCFGMIKYGL